MNPATLTRIELKLDKILEILETEVVPDCDTMVSHINFVDSVYETVKTPMSFVLNKLRTSKIELPERKELKATPNNTN